MLDFIERLFYYVCERGTDMKDQIIREIDSIEDPKLLDFLYRFIVTMKKHHIPGGAADQSGHTPGTCGPVSDHAVSAHVQS